jgi:cell division septum initiation protein DivIVA
MRLVEGERTEQAAGAANAEESTIASTAPTAQAGDQKSVEHAHIAASAIVAEAEARAAEIVEDAERKATETLADAEAAKLRFEREIARERALVAEERAKLSGFLEEVLDAVQRSGVSEGSVLDLTELRALKGRAQGRD